MTRKDYELIAKALREARQPFLGDDDLDAFDAAVWALGDALQLDNPRFSYARFNEAVGSV
jgi:hypothetical protein